jgi:hypothetical protein
MPIRSGAPRVVRIIEGLSGEVPMRFELHARFANGYTVPREAGRDSTSSAIAGPDAVFLRGGPTESRRRSSTSSRSGPTSEFATTWPGRAPTTRSRHRSTSRRRCARRWSTGTSGPRRSSCPPSTRISSCAR